MLHDALYEDLGGGVIFMINNQDFLLVPLKIVYSLGDLGSTLFKNPGSASDKCSLLHLSFLPLRVF